jgi:hypothetical protein
LDLYLGKDFGNNGVFYHEGTSGATLFDKADFDATISDESKGGGKVKLAYNLIKSFLPVITEDYASMTKDQNESELETAKTTLEGFQTAANNASDNSGKALIGRT